VGDLSVRGGCFDVSSGTSEGGRLIELVLFYEVMLEEFCN